ncbi:MAG: hypothetical protein K1V68_04540, partial [Alistipes sp.]
AEGALSVSRKYSAEAMYDGILSALAGRQRIRRLLKKLRIFNLYSIFYSYETSSGRGNAGRSGELRWF